MRKPAIKPGMILATTASHKAEPGQDTCRTRESTHCSHKGVLQYESYSQTINLKATSTRTQALSTTAAAALLQTFDTT